MFFQPFDAVNHGVDQSFLSKGFVWGACKTLPKSMLQVSCGFV